MLFYWLKWGLSELLPHWMFVSNIRLISDTNPNDNLMEKRKTCISNNFIFPSDIAKIINSYDYHLEGKSYTFLAHTSVTCISVLPDGRIVSGSGYKTIKIWNLVSGKCDMILHVTDTWVTSIATLLDGRIAIADCSMVRIWNPITKQYEGVRMEYGRILCIVTLSDGRLIMGSSSGLIIIWNVKNTKIDVSLMSHKTSIRCIIELPDKKVASAADDGLIKIWNIQTDIMFPICVRTIVAHFRKQVYITTLLDGRILAASNGGRLKIWNADLSTLEHDKYVYELNDIKCISVLPDGNVVFGCDNKLKIFDPYTGNCTNTLSGHYGQISCVIVLPDGRIVSGSVDTTLKLWC